MVIRGADESPSQESHGRLDELADETLRVTRQMADALKRRDVDAVARLCSPLLVVHAPDLGVTDHGSLITQLTKLFELCEESRYQVGDTMVAGPRGSDMAVVALRSSKAQSAAWLVGTAQLAYEVSGGQVVAAWVNVDLPAFRAQWNASKGLPPHSVRSDLARARFDPVTEADATIRVAEPLVPVKPSRRWVWLAAATLGAAAVGVATWIAMPLLGSDEDPASTALPVQSQTLVQSSAVPSVPESPVPVLPPETTPSGVASIPVVGGQAIRISETVLFDRDSAQLRPEAAQLIATIADQLRQSGPGRVSVRGHAADVGPGDGIALSQQRADAVADVLRSYLADAPITVEATGLGETQPVVPNDSEQNRSQNRRVEIVRLDA